MYEAVWDEKNNSVILLENTIDKEIVSPRPVFFEELDLLGFADVWKYPRTNAPLLWAIGRDYYYKGVLVARVTGGDLYKKPDVEIIHKGCLEPVDLSHTILSNTDIMNNVIGEALEFIRRVQKEYRRYPSQLTVSFSGGKDSQVVLDLVSRVVNPDNYIVIYTDTGMEIPCVEDTVKNTIKSYHSKYPAFNFITAHPTSDTDKLWDLFGPPSQKIRWCCSVCKSVPFVQTLRKHVDNQKLSNIIVFEGVRAEESSRRNKYKRIASNVKHINLINARPIFEWSTTEVFLYLFQRNIEINKAYRQGMWRVGCSVCPFASKPANYYLGVLFPKQTEKFVKHIHKLALSRGMTDSEKIKTYISDRSWAGRSGGIGIDNFGVSNDIVITAESYKAIIRRQRENLLEWLKTLGTMSIKQKNETTEVEILIQGVYIQISITKVDDTTLTLTSKNVNEYPVIRGLLTKIVNKTTYCVHCGLCEVECPIQAISFKPSLKIDESCVHCHKCSTSIEKGCILAQSLQLPIGGEKMKKSTTGLDRYKKFGMREMWVNSFLSDPERWFETNTLGTDQIPSFKRWLKDANLLNNSNSPSELVGVLASCEYNDVIWQIVWVNLFYNSPIVNWYISLPFDRAYTKNELLELLLIEFPGIARSTLNNPLSALLNTFDNSPLGSTFRIGEIEKKGKSIERVMKRRLLQINTATMIYALYKYAEVNNKYYLTVRELIDSKSNGGPIKIFGLKQSNLVEVLRGIQEYDSELLKVDLVANLDNINLNKNYNPIGALIRYFSRSR
ncbi:MAG TPA: phosphoadenosine phosphosulfate reductase family protein [Candidatus Cloacimonas sp.]|nr:phosphoadenosine phosphosulfate reductase family protein [Candidatus Cloacimonas sp.]